MSDLRWTSQGGVLMDGTGDIAITLTSIEELETMVATRLKAAHQWMEVVHYWS